MNRLTRHMYLSFVVQNVCLWTVVYDVSDSLHPKMPCTAKVFTNSFLDIMTVKCQSWRKGNSQIPLMMTDSFVHIFAATKMEESQAHACISHKSQGSADPDFPNSKGGCEKLLLLPATKVCEGYAFTGVCPQGGLCLGRVLVQGVCHWCLYPGGLCPG